jgi:hypothetical protein
MLAKAFLFVTRGRFLAAMIFLLAPGGIYTMAAENEYYIRKEMLFVLFLWSVVAIGRVLASRARPLFVAYVGVGSLLLPFVHEGFIFFCSVPLALLLYNAVAPRIGLAVAQGYLSMCGLVFAVFAVFKGTPQAVLDIWQSIGPANRDLLSSTGQPEFAIRTIGWSFSNALDLPVHVIEDGMAWYWLVPLVFSIALCIYLAVTTAKDHPGGRRLTAGRALVLYGALLTGALPLFALGWDWGRWIAFTTVAFLVVFDGIDRMPDPLERLAGDVALRLPQALAGISALSVGLGLLVFELTFRMPACCITVRGSDWSILHTLARFTHRAGGG